MKNLRGLRKAKKMTMKDFGKLIGVAESTVSLYETGKRAPDYATLNKIAAFFQVPVDFLLTGDACEWENHSLYEDYWNANDDDRLRIVSKLGIAYAIAADYYRIVNARLSCSQSEKKKPIVEGDELTENERKLILNYRAGKRTAGPSEEEPAALLQKPYMKEILKALDRLTPESLELVLAQVRAVADLQSSAKKEAVPHRKGSPQN